MANTITHWREFFGFDADAYFEDKQLNFLSFRESKKGDKLEVSLVIMSDNTVYTEEHAGDPDDELKTISFWTEDLSLSDLEKGERVYISDVNAYVKDYNLVIKDAVIKRTPLSIGE